MSETCVEVKDRVVILVSGGVSNGTAFTGAAIAGATEKTIPVDADVFPLADSAASNVLKKVTWANIKATLKTYFDTLYAKLAGGNTFTGAQVITHDATSGTPLRINLPSGYSGTVLNVVNSAGASLMNLTHGATLTVGNDLVVSDSITAGGNIVVGNDITAGGDISGANFTGSSIGVNTGDQDLSGKADLAGGNAFTGNQEIDGSLTLTGDLSAANLSGTNTGDQDLSVKANLAGGNTFTGNQTFSNNATVSGSFTQGTGTNFTCGAVNVSLTAPTVWRTALGLNTMAAFDTACTDGNFRYVPTYSPSSPVTSDTITGLALVDEIHYLTPAGTLAALTWLIPSSGNARVGQIKRLRSSQAVTNISVQMDGGSGTFLGTTTISAAADTTYEWMCVDTSGTGTWLRIS